MKKINCPLCAEKYKDLTGLYTHVESEHSDSIPEGYSVQQYLYYIKTGKTHGNCVMCKKPTGWNESTGKYKRFCENPKCKDKYREEFKKRMVGKYGKTTLLNDPEQQRKMLAHRHISGEYIWSDGTKKSYTGSYELDFLRMLDVFMNFDSDDVMTPSPHTYYYIYENEKKFYIPDIFIPSLGLEIEIKDGGDNPNMHGKIQAVDKVKEKLKDDVMMSQKEYDYIKIVNKNYDGFFEYLMSRKEKTANAKNIPIGDIIQESSIEEYSDELVDESYEPVTEVSSRIRDIDEYYDFDFFVNGDTRFLFVTGLPASSKIRTAHDISSAFNAEYIDLDLFTSSIINLMLNGGYMGGASKEYVSIIIDYAQTHLPHNPHNPLNVLQPTDTQTIDFINTLITKLNRNKRYVIQGCHIYRYYESLKYLVDRSSVIIVNDAVSKSMKQYTLAKNALVYNIINDELKDVSKYKSWFFSEAQKLNEFSKAIVEYRKDSTEFKYTKKFYPVYVALIFSGSALAHAIQKVTGDEFSHSLISFDPSLRAMYSFGPTLDGLSLELGMVHEDITQAVYRKPIKYALYVTFVTADELKAMKRTLYSIHSQGRKIKYNMEGLVKYAVGLNPETKNKLFCSEFVATVLNTDKNRTDGLRAAEVRPESFKTLSNYTLVQRGIMTEYNMDVTIERTKTLIKKCK